MLVSVEEREEVRDGKSDSEPARVVPVKVDDCDKERDLGSKAREDVMSKVVVMAVGRGPPVVVERAGRRSR